MPDVMQQLDMSRFFPSVVQAVPAKDRIVFAYMNDGSIRRFDMKPLIESGGVFEPLRNPEVFASAITVLNDTVAWDLDGNRDPAACIDIDPFILFEQPAVHDPLAEGESVRASKSSEYMS